MLLNNSSTSGMTATLIPRTGPDGACSVQFHVNGMPRVVPFESQTEAQMWCQENGFNAVSPSWVSSMKGSS